MIKINSNLKFNTMKTRLLFLMLFFGIIATSQAQVSISAEGNDPNESAMLDITSTDKGLLIPRMSSAERADISNPANGLMVFDISTNTFWFYSDATSQWEEMGGAIVSMLNDLLDAKTDANSVYIGYQSGVNNDGNNSNTAVGNKSLKNNTSGSNNLALGKSALLNNTTGNANVALGYNTLGASVSGNNNVAIGQNAGSSIGEDASGNVFLGFEAGKTEDGSNKLIIENSDSQAPLIGGDFSTDEVSINGDLEVTEGLTVTNDVDAQANLTVGNNLAVGQDLNIVNSATVGYNLNVNDSISTQALRVTGGTIADGKILISDANGNASWQDAPISGAQELNELIDAKTDANSVFIGSEAGLNDEGENSNVAIGISSLKANIDGENNAAIGNLALTNNTNGIENTAIGSMALGSNTIGNRNTAVGQAALATNQTGSDNVAIGDRSLLWNAGEQNTAIGKSAGMNSTNTSGNVFIGFEAGKYEASNNRLYIENSSSAIPLIGGDFENDYVNINGTLNVNGTLKITGGNPVNGRILTTDDNGNASWQDAAVYGASELNDLTDAASSANSLYLGLNSGENQADDNYNTAVGQYSLMNSTNGFSNTALGNNAMNSNTNGNNNTAIGISALQYNTNGNQNTTIGSYSLLNNMGSYNTAIGYQAGQGTGAYNTIGNVLIGYQAGYYEIESGKLYIENSNSTSPLIGGDFNTDEVIINGTLAITGGSPAEGKVLVSDADGKASWEDIAGAQNINGLEDGKTHSSSLYLGNQAGENDDNKSGNTGIGFFSLYNNGIGMENTAVGTNSMGNSSSGNYNVAIGSTSLQTNLNGSKNTVIGYRAGIASEIRDISGSVMIGYKAGYDETEDNKLYIENSDSATPLIGGDFETDEVVINGTLQITGGNPAAGNVLVSDADGKASWENAGGAQNINDLNDAMSDNSSIYLGSYGSSDQGNNNNTAVGISALNSNQIGSYNAAFGKSSLLSNNSGTNNSAFGASSMELSTNGINNTAIGSGSLYNNGSGSNNTALGFEAGFGSYGANASGNVFLGYKAGYNETTSNKLYIDNSDTYYPLVYGDFDQNKLEVNGEFKVANSSITNFKVDNTKLEANVNIDANANVDIAGDLNVDGETTIEAITVDGDLTANEKIIANNQIEAHDDIILSDNKNITYENVRTGKLQISGLDFQHGGTGDPYMTTANYGPGGFYFETQEEYIYFSLYAPIKLPQGVTITKMTIGFASTLGTELNMKIIKKTPLDLMGNGDELLSVDYTFNTEELHTYSNDGLNNATIDNDYVYLLDFFGLMTKEDGAFNAIFSVLTVTLEYEYTELNY